MAETHTKATPQRLLITYAVLGVMLVITVYPTMWVFKMAFDPANQFTADISPIPKEFSLANFHAVIFGQPFFRWLFNSVVVSLGATLIGVFLACTAGYAFSRFRFPGRQGMMLGFLVTQMFPGTLMMIPIYILMDVLGLIGTLRGLMLVYSVSSIPFCVWMLKGYFDTIPQEIEEAAIIDGASRFYIFWRIMMPLAAPAVAVTALFSFMTAWNEFILAATFMDSEQMYTLPVGLQMMVGEFASEWGHFAAGSILVSIPIVALFYALQKNLVSGLTQGGVKG